jgi:hypothetical protein
MLRLGIEIVQIQALNGKMMLSFEQNRMNKAYEIVDYYDRKRPLSITIHFRGEDHIVEYVLAPKSFLNYITPGEHFGIYAYGMILVSSEIAYEHPGWVYYIVAKLFLEPFVDEGLDKTGRAKHFASLMTTIRVAGVKMPQAELVEFLEKMMAEEQSHYFEIDGEVKKFLEDAKDPDSRRRRRLEYLSHHHRNFWVRLGREAEELDRLGYDPAGYRNLAEAAYRSLESDVASMFLAATLIRQIAELGQGAIILIPRQHIKVSYALTYEGSGGRVEIIRILEETSEGDIVEKLGHNKTWHALVKRLSHGIHQTELRVEKVIEARRQDLNQTINLGKERNVEIGREIAVLREEIARKSQPFESAAEKLRKLSGNWQNEVASLASLSEQLSSTLVDLSSLQEALAEVV